MLKRRLVAVGVAVGMAVASSASAMAQTRGDYASVNGLDMYYYEIHGARARLAVLPGTTHVTLIDRADWPTPMVTELLDAPMPDPK